MVTLDFIFRLVHSSSEDVLFNIMCLSVLEGIKQLYLLMWYKNIRLETPFKDKDYCPIEIIKGLTDKGQFQYLTKLMGPQEGTYLYATQFHSLR